jgi:hypothetical protein
VNIIAQSLPCSKTTSSRVSVVNLPLVLFMAAPLRIEKGMGSPLNPLAIF